MRQDDKQVRAVAAATGIDRASGLQESEVTRVRTGWVRGRASGDHALCRKGPGAPLVFRAVGRFHGRDNVGSEDLSHVGISRRYDRGQAGAGAANTGVGRPLLKGGVAHATDQPLVNLAWSEAFGKRRFGEISGQTCRSLWER